MRPALEPMLAYDVSSNSVLQHVTNIRATIRTFSPRIKSNNGSRSKSQSLLESSTMLQPTLEVSINAGQKYGQVLEYANGGQLVFVTCHMYNSDTKRQTTMCSTLDVI
jgi:predicted component of type VI protein secretion system